MAGVKISELDPTFELNDTDTLPLARLGLGNGTTHKIYGSVFGKAADVTALQNDKVTKNNAITGATKTKITYDSKGLVTAGFDLAASDLPSGIDASKIANGSVSNTEFQCLSSATSDIQAQINALNSTLGSLGKTWADFKCP